jgi:uncharacterized protein YwqG
MQTPDIAATLGTLGLERIADRVLAQIRPCTRLVLGAAGAGPVGGSRIGGQPDAPAGTAWPLMPDGTPMTFVLQLALGEAGPLAGTLALFVGAIDGACDVPHCLWLTPPGTRLQTLAAPEPSEDDDEIFGDLAVHQLTLVSGIDLPGWYSLDYERVVEGLSDDEVNAYNKELIWSLEPDTTRPVLGKLFGHVAGIGSDPREDALVWEQAPDRMYDSAFSAEVRQADRDGARQRQWTALLTVDSCGELDLCIGDAGYIQFMIKEAQVAAGDLSRSYGQLESS